MRSETLCLMVLEQSTIRVGDAVVDSVGAADGDGAGTVWLMLWEQ